LQEAIQRHGYVDIGAALDPLGGVKSRSYMRA
jgi:hypothetical protein